MVARATGLRCADHQHLTILRAIDKLDRLGSDAVQQLLGEGRKDESGDYTKGAGLAPDQIAPVMDFVATTSENPGEVISSLAGLVGNSAVGRDGIAELETMADLFAAAGYDSDRILLDPSVVRGLGYYTGPVYEAELTFETTDDDGTKTRFGSVGGGGRYDGLVQRFKGVEVPATGFSVGISRLYSALDALGKISANAVAAPVVVLVMDPDRLPDYQKMAITLRTAGVRAEMYLGTSGMRAQMKYADRRGAPAVVIQGEDERDRGEVTVKDLVEGARLSEEIEDNAEWRSGRPAQISVAESDLVSAVKQVLARHRS